MERPPQSLWNRILAQPERAPELIAMAASDRFGPQAEEWVRVAGAGHTPEQLAKVAYKKHVRLARLRERFGEGLDDPEARFELALALRGAVVSADSQGES